MRQYICEFEGVQDELNGANDMDEFDSLIMDCKLSDDDENSDANIPNSSFLTSFGPVDGYDVLSVLNSQSTRHAATKMSPHSEGCVEETYVIGKRYGPIVFQGIVIDTGAAKCSTAGYDQYQALKRIRSQIQLDKSRAGEAKIQFGEGLIKNSIGTVDVKTPVGTVTFHVLKSTTPFLFSLRDMDRMKIEFRNLRNVLV